jgi:tellurite resistance protein
MKSLWKKTVSASQKLAGKAGDAYDKAGELASEAGDKISDVASDVADNVGDRVDNFKSKGALKDLVKAHMSASAFASVNDCEDDDGEQRAAIEHVLNNQEVNAVYTSADLEDIYNDYKDDLIEDMMSDDPQANDGVQAVLKATKVFYGQEEATEIINTMMVVAEHDGVVKASEKLALKEVIKNLNLNPADWGITESTAELEKLEEEETAALAGEE